MEGRGLGVKWDEWHKLAFNGLLQNWELTSGFYKMRQFFFFDYLQKCQLLNKKSAPEWFWSWRDNRKQLRALS